MAFLDNSGDIILDAVLTDLGRERLARADGSFRITKFALGDDEIDYALYDKNDSRGSAFYDLEILQTPILEAFTNSASSMKSHLLTIPRTNLLYLPVIMLNEVNPPTRRNNQANQAKGAFIVAVNKLTVENISGGGDSGTSILGLMLGATPQAASTAHIRLDQGLNTAEIPPTQGLDSDLRETQYMVEIDNRFGSIVSVNGTEQKASFVDDNQIASYYFVEKDGSEFVTSITDTVSVNEGTSQIIKGPRGTRLEFKIASSLDLRSSDYLFTTLGSTGQSFRKAKGATNATVSTIDTQVRVTGLTTGYRVDVPVHFIKS